jgi:hypothetical protein
MLICPFNFGKLYQTLFVFIFQSFSHEKRENTRRIPMNKEKNPRQEKPKCSAFEAQASMLDAVILFFFFKVRLFILFYFFLKRERIYVAR